MIIATKGIVLRVVKYGETSIICSVFTELLGLQSYLIKGVRSDKKQSQKGNIFRPGNILELQVYHQKDKNLQYIKEFQLAHFYNSINENVLKSTVLLFAIEVLNNFVLTEDAQEDLFEFSINFLKHLDQISELEIANLPVFFLKETAKRMGYIISDNYSEENCYLNTIEGCFQQEKVLSGFIFDKQLSKECYLLIQDDELLNINSHKINAGNRRAILEGYIHFLQWHDKSFKSLKSLPILQAILH